MPAPMNLKQYVAQLARRSKKVGFLGLAVLGACSTPIIPRDALTGKEGRGKFEGPGVPERLPAGKLLPAAVQTVSPTGDFNPTSYLNLGITRNAQGKVHVTPFIGTFYTLPDSRNPNKDGSHYVHLAALPNDVHTRDSAILAGLGRTFAEGKVAAGVGASTHDYQKKATATFGGKVEVAPGTQVFVSTDFEAFRETARINLQQRLPDIMKVAPTLFLETGPRGAQDFRVGKSFELGKSALDFAWSKFDEKISAQYSHSFGADARHFLFVGGSYEPRTNNSSVFVGINLTGYRGLFGGGKRQRTGNKPRTPELVRFQPGAPPKEWKPGKRPRTPTSKPRVARPELQRGFRPTARRATNRNRRR